MVLVVEASRLGALLRFDSLEHAAAVQHPHLVLLDQLLSLPVGVAVRPEPIGMIFYGVSIA